MGSRTSVLLKLGAFALVALLAGVMEFNTLTAPHTGSTRTYHAIFAGADGVSGLRGGDPVKVSGVAVGKVTGTDLLDASHVRVSFTANDNQTLTSNTFAVVRYANLLGQRYLALTRSGPGGTRLRPGGTIPQQRTAPALSLTALFNGFRPLFQGLSAQEVNQLSGDIIAVLQGQGDRLESLLRHTAELTGDLAERDSTFNQVVDHLASLLGTLARHDDQLAGLVSSLHALTGELHAQGPAILDSLDGVDALIGSLARLLPQLEQHGLSQNIQAINTTAGVLAHNSDTLGRLITGFVTAFGDFSRVSQNGNWVNIYPCIVVAQTYGQPRVTLADGLAGIAQALGPLGGLLSSLGIGVGALGSLALPLPLPLKVPVGPVGSATDHSAVCR
jgi:phospholipid/cholesterol/gamma-HCH transport system substrate-binding protein